MDALSAAVVRDSPKFALLTNHAHVLLAIAQKPDVRMREIAATIGITERAVQRIVDDLTTGGYILVTKDGRRTTIRSALTSNSDTLSSKPATSAIYCDSCSRS